MAPDQNNPGGWNVPDGFTLVCIPGHYVDDQGFAVTGSGKPLRTTPDGTRDVPVWDESEPFRWEENDGKDRPFGSLTQPSQEAREAAAAGTPLAGWNPNVTFQPIKDSWMPPQFVLTWDDDPTPVTEPASVTTRELTPEEERRMLQASIEHAQARLAELGSAS